MPEEAHRGAKSIPRRWFGEMSTLGIRARSRRRWRLPRQSVETEFRPPKLSCNASGGVRRHARASAAARRPTASRRRRKPRASQPPPKTPCPQPAPPWRAGFGPKPGDWGHDHCWWLDRMVRSGQQLIERMTLVWHSSFATSVEASDAQLMIRQNQMIRARAGELPRPAARGHARSGIRIDLRIRRLDRRGRLTGRPRVLRSPSRARSARRAGGSVRGATSCTARCRGTGSTGCARGCASRETPRLSAPAGATGGESSGGLAPALSADAVAAVHG